MNLTIATIIYIFSLISLKLIKKNNNDIDNLKKEVRSQLEEINILKMRNNEGVLFTEKVDKSIQTDLSSNELSNLIDNSLIIDSNSVVSTELNILPFENNISLSLPNFQDYILLDDSNLIDSMESFLLI
uniref:Uncharacterized protein n=1 Tax=Clavaria fumosa TaxID=264083 RepID=A0A7T3PCV2_9AGAR|nr:hypothetical protein KQ422_mgp078 [Clavaria fumosa]QPZ51122.1 hypothetical protein [Clavaria fumosa]